MSLLLQHPRTGDDAPFPTLDVNGGVEGQVTFYAFGKCANPLIQY
jgi:hypothetical protein